MLDGLLFVLGMIQGLGASLSHSLACYTLSGRPWNGLKIPLACGSPISICWFAESFRAFQIVNPRDPNLGDTCATLHKLTDIRNPQAAASTLLYA